jgi:hypothetical protein
MTGTVTHISESGLIPRPPASPPQTACSPRHELLMGDMWVEAPVHAPSPHGSSYSSPDVRASRPPSTKYYARFRVNFFM